MTVVGVAADAKNGGISGDADPEYYRLRMSEGPLVPRSAVAVFRTSLAPATLTRWICEEFAAIDPSLPITVETMQTRVSRFTDRPRFIAFLVILFATFASLLAGVGLYGVLSFLVAQRTREIGVRMALGAKPREVAVVIQRYAIAWAGIGIFAGTLGALAATRAIKGLLFGVAPSDGLSLATAAGALAVLAALAAWVPSYRAARVDPVVALRHE